MGNLCGGGGGDDATTTVQLPAWVRRYIEPAFGEAWRIYGGYPYSAGPQVPPMPGGATAEPTAGGYVPSSGAYMGGQPSWPGYGLPETAAQGMGPGYPVEGGITGEGYSRYRGPYQPPIWIPSDTTQQATPAEALPTTVVGAPLPPGAPATATATAAPMVSEQEQQQFLQNYGTPYAGLPSYEEYQPGTTLVPGGSEGERLAREARERAAPGAPAYYPEPTVAGFTRPQEEAQRRVLAAAAQASPLLGGYGAEGWTPGSAGELISRTLGGGFLGEANPYLQQMYEQGAQDITRTFQEATMPAIRASALGAGAYGGTREALARGEATRGLAQELGHFRTGIFAPAYEAERGRQMAAMPAAFQLAEEPYARAGRVAAVGQEQQAMQQALINAARQRHEYGQMAPWLGLGLYRNVLTGQFGGTTTTG